MSSLAQRYALLVVIIALGFVLRVMDLGGRPLRGDEAFSASYWAGLPLSESLTRIATLEPHPPLTYAVFRLWGLWTGSKDELALRMLPVLGNLIGVSLAYALGSRLFGRRVGYLSALLWAVAPYLIWHARDFRNYALWASFNLLNIYVAWLAVQRPSRQAFVRYGLVACCAGLFFYFDLLFVSAVTVFGFFVFRRAQLVAWLWVNGLVVTAVVLVFFVFQGQLFFSGGYGGNAASFSWDGLFELPRVLLFGEAFFSAFSSLFIAAAVLLALACAAAQVSDRRFLFLLALIAVPLLLWSVVSLRVAVFQPRYVLPIVGVLLILLAACSFRWVRWSLPVVSVFVALQLYGIARLYSTNDYGKSADWWQVRDFLAAYADEGDAIIQTTVDAAFGFYVDPLMLTAAIPASPQDSAQHIDTVMSNLDRQHFTIWLFEHSFYDWPNRRAARDWLEKHRVRIDETTVMGAQLARYLPLTIRSQELPNTHNAITSIGAILVGYHVEQVEDELRVRLYWSNVPDTPLAASVQVIGAWNPALNNPIWAQSDHPLSPSAGLQRDVHILRLTTVPSGRYTIILKLYDPTNSGMFSIDGRQEFSLGSLDRP